NCTFMLLCVAPKRYDSFWEQRNFPDAFLSARDSFFRGFLDSLLEMKRAYDFGGIFGEASKNHDKIPTANLRSHEMHPF
ncbi:MAG: hypothetical protein WAT92_18560, partial [Saprospiraceae bacterium]